MRKFTFTTFDPNIVTLAVTYFIVVFGEIDAAGQHVDGRCDVTGRQACRGDAQAVRLKDELRQVELQIGIYAPA